MTQRFKNGLSSRFFYTNKQMRNNSYKKSFTIKTLYISYVFTYNIYKDLINKSKKIDVTAIGDNNNFLSKIYTNDEFNFISTPVNLFDYNTVNEQHLLILNELESIPAVLTNTLNEFINKGGSLVIIPPINLDINTYTTALQNFNIGNLSSVDKKELAINTINFSHPLLNGVFEKKIENFQYPTVKSSYNVNYINNSSILKFENNKPFISQINVNNGLVYWFSSAINVKNSNFKNSPLIVPIFYNFGLHSSKLSQLYYTIGKPNAIEINAQLKKDEVIHLATVNEDFIPQQEITAKKVIIKTESNPIHSGLIKVRQNEKVLKYLAYNYDRTESDLSTIDVNNHFNEASNIIHIDSVNEAFIKLSDKYKTNSLWQLFLFLALIFLITEVLLLKFLKS